MKKIHYLFMSVILTGSLFMACSDDNDNETPTPEPVKNEIDINFTTKDIAIGSTFELKATITSNAEVTPKALWSSDKPNIATVDENGTIKGISTGTAIITATLDCDSTKTVTCTVNVVTSSIYNYKYRLILKDKGTTTYSTSKPEEFLSSRSIQRRQRQNIAIDETDLPISQEYIKRIEELGGIIVAKSKWLNTVTVHCTEEFMAEEYKKLPFVEDAIFVWRAGKNTKNSSSGNNPKFSTETSNMITPKSIMAGEYGLSRVNISTNNGEVLHQKGFKGEGMEIAVLDAGFKNADKVDFIKQNIKGEKSFVYEEPGIYNSKQSHGLEVLSCMAADKKDYFIGTAPAAKYWLFVAEQNSCELPIEEDYWVAAAEYADSVGVDLINSSIGYKRYDSPAKSYTSADMDGKTAFTSRGADMAANKGILVVCSAGNDASWVGTPEDAHYVLTVGGIKPDGSIYTQSSYGKTADGRIKPDVVALGNSAFVVHNGYGNASWFAGTSFSSPIMCGLAACLWQAYPKLTNKELLEVLRKSGNKYDNPVARFGYGAPDMEKAMQLAKEKSDSK